MTNTINPNLVVTVRGRLPWYSRLAIWLAARLLKLVRVKVTVS